MNCDLAFDLMTDAAGCGSQALKSHLTDCPRCRQMQETLAPALDWLSESPMQDDSEPLPPSLAGWDSAGLRASPETAIEALEIANETAERLLTRALGRPVRRLPSIGTFCRSAALIALGAFAAFAFVPGVQPAVEKEDDQNCVRHDVAAAASHSPARLNLLVATCNICHEPDGALRRADRRTGALNSRSAWSLAGTREEFQRLWLPAAVDDGFVAYPEIAKVVRRDNSARSVDLRNLALKSRPAPPQTHKMLCVEQRPIAIYHKIVNCFDKPRARWL
jgi:hypothetical protein